MNAIDITSAIEHIATLDFTTIKTKLMHVASGEGWSAEHTDAVEGEYRRFLTLMKLYPNETTAPLVDVDTFWHYHILDTAKYAADCDVAFGYFLHHYPYLGMAGEEDLATRDAAGARLHAMYAATFGVGMDSAPAAWCGAATAEPAATAWCGAATAQSATAWCGATTQAPAAAQALAWCGAATAVPVKQGLAWCGAATALPVKQGLAWCGAATARPALAWCGAATARPAQQSLAWCGAATARPVSQGLAWCGAATSLQVNDDLTLTMTQAA